MMNTVEEIEIARGRRRIARGGPGESSPDTRRLSSRAAEFRQGPQVRSLLGLPPTAAV